MAFPHLDLIRITNSHQSYDFPEESLEIVQFVRFKPNEKSLLITFHSGTVYFVRDVTEPLGPGNVRFLKKHEDYVLSTGFMPGTDDAFTMSVEGAMVRHHLSESKPSQLVFKRPSFNDTRLVLNQGAMVIAWDEFDVWHPLCEFMPALRQAFRDEQPESWRSCQ